MPSPGLAGGPVATHLWGGRAGRCRQQLVGPNPGCQPEQRSPHRHWALTQPHEASAVGERGKRPSPRAADNEATVPGNVPHDRSTAPPDSPAGTHAVGRTLQHTRKRGVGPRWGEPWAPHGWAQAPARNTGELLPGQASFLSQPRALLTGQQRRWKRKSQGSEVTSRTQTRQSSLSHAQPRATRLNVRHRWSCSPCPSPLGPHAADPTALPTPCRAPHTLHMPHRGCCPTAEPRARSPCRLGRS